MTLHFCARSRATVPGDEHACACTRAALCCCFPCPLCHRTAVGGGAVSRTGGPTNRITAATGRSARVLSDAGRREFEHSARLYPSYDESFKNMAARGFVLLSFCFSGHLGESLLPVDPGG